MSLQNVQMLLAKLYTDPQIRESFFLDPEQTASDFGLSVQEQAQILELSKPLTRTFAHSLVHKRQGVVQKLLPCTFQSMGPLFNKAFHAFSSSYVPVGVRKHKEDAVRFALFLQEWIPLQADDTLPVYCIELARFEACWVEAHHPDVRWMLRTFRYPVHMLVQNVRTSKELPDSCAPRWTCAFWWRWSSRSTLSFFVR